MTGSRSSIARGGAGAESRREAGAESGGAGRERPTPRFATYAPCWSSPASSVAPSGPGSRPGWMIQEGRSPTSGSAPRHRFRSAAAEAVLSRPAPTPRRRRRSHPALRSGLHPGQVRALEFDERAPAGGQLRELSVRRPVHPDHPGRGSPVTRGLLTGSSDSPMWRQPACSRPKRHRSPNRRWHPQPWRTPPATLKRMPRAYATGLVTRTRLSERKPRPAQASCTPGDELVETVETLGADDRGGISPTRSKSVTVCHRRGAAAELP